MGFGGIFKKIGKAVGKIAGSPIGQIGLSLIPGGGIVSTIARQAGGALASKYGGGGTPQVLPGGGALALPPSFGPLTGGMPFSFGKGALPSFEELKKYAPGAYAKALANTPNYSSGLMGYRRRRRMNAGNAKAARRAIRRIKAVRNMLRQIESQLPKRHVCATRRIGFRRR